MRHLTFDPTGITNRRQLNEALDALMEYPSWYDDNMDDWIELISYYDSHVSPVGTSLKNENFQIEVLRSSEFLQSRTARFRDMVEIIAEVNRRYKSRTGFNVVSIVFST